MKPRFRSYSLAVLLVVFSSAGTEPILGQQDAKPPVGRAALRGATLQGATLQDTTLKDTVDVDIFNLEVWVSSRQGAAIEGLAAADFELRENGVEVEPTNFFEVKGTARAKAARTEPLRLVLYVDNHNLRSASRDRALEEIEEDLRPLFQKNAPEIMVVSYDSELEVIQRFSDQWSDVARALARLRGAPSVGDDRDAYRRSAQVSATEAFQKARGSDRLDRQNAALAIDALLGEMRSFAKEAHVDAEKSLTALGTVIRSLAWARGPKALIYLSDGLAERPLGELVKQLQNLMTGGASSAGDLVETRSGGQADTAPGAGGVFSRDATMEVGRFQQEIDTSRSTDTIAAVVAEANAYGVVIYAAKPPPGDAEASSRRSKSRGSLIELSDLREALHSLADGTGGVANTAANSLEGFASEAVSSLEAPHYSIGLSAAGKADGEYTALDVEVKKRGAQVRSAKGYIKKGLATRISERAIAGLELGVSDNPQLIEAHIESMEPSAVDGGQFDVQIRIEVPIRNLRLVEHDGVHVAEARMVIVSMNDDDRLTAAQHLGLPIEIPDGSLEEARKSHYRGSVSLRLPAGRQRVALGLWDEAAGVGSILTDALMVGPQ